MPLATKEAEMPSPEPSSNKWLLQIRRGELRLINDLAELIRLVLERRVDRTALLYRISEHPRAIADVPELAELFDSPSTPPPRLSGPDAVSGSFDPNSNDVPDLESISPLGSTDTAFGDYYDEVPRSRAPAAFLVLIGLAALGGGGYFVLRHNGSTSAPLAAVPAPAPPPVTLPPPAASAPAPTPAPTAAATPAPAPEPAPTPAASLPPPAPTPTPAPVTAAVPEP